MRMTVALLYLAGCPNYLVADQRFREALVAVGRAGTEVEHVLVSTDQEAEVLSFHGSPTVLVDGLDPFAAADAPVALACRLYRTETGVAGSPTVAQLVAVLRWGDSGAAPPDQPRTSPAAAALAPFAS